MELFPFESFGIKIMSAPLLQNRRRYFYETWYKYKPLTENVTPQISSLKLNSQKDLFQNVLPKYSSQENMLPKEFAFVFVPKFAPSSHRKEFAPQIFPSKFAPQKLLPIILLSKLIFKRNDLLNFAPNKSLLPKPLCGAVIAPD